MGSGSIKRDVVLVRTFLLCYLYNFIMLMGTFKMERDYWGEVRHHLTVKFQRVDITTFKLLSKCRLHSRYMLLGFVTVLLELC